MAIHEFAPDHRSGRVSFPAETGHLAEVRAFVVEACRQAALAGTPVGETGPLELALTEAVANIVKHGFPGEETGMIVLEYHAEDAMLAFTLKDVGIPYDPAKIPPADLEQVRESGYGWHILRSVMDEITYRRTADDANCLVLKKAAQKETPEG